MAVGGGVKLPPDLDLHSKNAYADWKFWESEFEDYLVSTGQDNAPDKVKISLLRNIMGSDSSRILQTVDMVEEDKKSYVKWKQAIERYVRPRINEVFERYVFAQRCQEEGESFEHFFTALRHLVKNCNYNNTTGESAENKMLRDRIVHGVLDKAVQEALLRVDNLTLEKAAAHCRACEQSKQQAHLIHSKNGDSESDTVLISAVSKSSSEQRQRPVKDGETKGEFQCRRCQSVHGPKACPAYGKKCAKCGVLNHFARSCRVRKVQVVERIELSSSQESLYCDSVSVCPVDIRGRIKSHRDSSSASYPNEWQEKVSIEGVKMMVKLDTGAQVSVLPLQVFKKVDKQFRVEPTNVKLKTLDGVITPVGKVTLNCQATRAEAYIDFMVVDLDVVPLLGLPGCIQLNLVQRVHSVDNRTAKDSFVRQNEDVFHGLGCFPQEGGG
ncbi:uncharacterized protein LOC134534803 [Bacillus rossius redtenbacheri]|uniref:uncharacterized protein LOC134534803 n=1 Tax=Bacillus rossius redtenbacheri TaxID=93214 RepID=UPI002FDCF559